MTVTQRASNFPQLGGQHGAYQPTTLAGVPATTASGNPASRLRFGNVDLKDPLTRRAAAATFTHSIITAPAATVESGKQWYPKVNDAVRKGVSQRGFMSHASDKMLSGAGIVAAVSPNMDWDSSNIGAFKELAGLKGHHWDAIMAATPGATTRAGLAGRQKAADAVKGLSIAASPLHNLQKAGRIIRGEHPDDVLSAKTAPKTNNFMHNIADPANPHHVTIDGRAFDTLTNTLRPWDTGRGIQSSQAATGRSTRYEDAASVVKHVASNFGMHPSAAQAVSWEHTKYNLEQAGGARKQGPTRRGQPYFHPATGDPVLHSRQFG